MTGTAARRRLPQRRRGVARWIGHASVIERVAALAALAALSAVTAVAWVHARQCEVEWNAKLDAQPDHVALLHGHEWSLDLDRVREPQREGARHGVEELRRGVG